MRYETNANRLPALAGRSRRTVRIHVDSAQQAELLGLHVSIFEQEREQQQRSSTCALARSCRPAHRTVHNSHGCIASRQRAPHRGHRVQPLHAQVHQLFRSQLGRLRLGHRRLLHVGANCGRREQGMDSGQLVLQGQLVHADGEHFGERVHTCGHLLRPFRGRRVSAAYTLVAPRDFSVHLLHVGVECVDRFAGILLPFVLGAALVGLCAASMRRRELANHARHQRARLCGRSDQSEQARLLHGRHCFVVLLANACLVVNEHADDTQAHCARQAHCRRVGESMLIGR